MIIGAKVLAYWETRSHTSYVLDLQKHKSVMQLDEENILEANATPLKWSTVCRLSLHIKHEVGPKSFCKRVGGEI